MAVVANGRGVKVGTRVAVAKAAGVILAVPWTLAAVCAEQAVNSSNREMNNIILRIC